MYALSVNGNGKPCFYASDGRTISVNVTSRACGMTEILLEEKTEKLPIGEPVFSMVHYNGCRAGIVNEEALRRVLGQDRMAGARLRSPWGERAVPYFAKKAARQLREDYWRFYRQEIGYAPVEELVLAGIAASRMK